MCGKHFWSGDRFPTDPSGSPEAATTQVVELPDGATFALHAGSVQKRIGEATLRMLAYNGSIPGPTLMVRQGSEVTVEFTNGTEIETTVHWHGLRLENRFDGVPQGTHGGMQPPVPIGGQYTYRLRFPDPGVFWYHPHIREDYSQELGLYGNIVVLPHDPDHWAPVNRELVLTLDDILLEGNELVSFSRMRCDHTMMGRFGNVLLINGETHYTLPARRGEVIRLYLTNTANVRTFNVAVPGARMKYVGDDGGRVEREVFVEEVLISPSERRIVELHFNRSGIFPIEHRTPDRTYTLGIVSVSDQPVDTSFDREFTTLRRSEELQLERARMAGDFDRPPDKTLSLAAEMPGMDHHHHGAGHEETESGIEWEDTMPEMNRASSPETMHWKLIDQETGAENTDIRWTFSLGDRVKIRIVNEPHSDHPMQHPIHFHGQRFLVLSRDGIPNENLVWKDTELVRTGQKTDILLDAGNPGRWMVHCHIAEHLESGMMFTFEVENGRF